MAADDIPPVPGEPDVTVRPIYSTGNDNAQVEDQQHPVLEREKAGSEKR